MATAPSTSPANSARSGRRTVDTGHPVAGGSLRTGGRATPGGGPRWDGHGARAGSRQTAAYGGGSGSRASACSGVVGFGLIRAEALLAAHRRSASSRRPPRRRRRSTAPGPGEPLELLVLGDCSAAGLGADVGRQTLGAIIATGVAALRGPPGPAHQRRRRRARSPGAWTSSSPTPSTTCRTRTSPSSSSAPTTSPTASTSRSPCATSRPRSAGCATPGAEVVVGTCPDLGTLEPVAQPLRSLARRWSRDLAAAQTIAVVEAGGRTVSLGDILGPEFEQRPHEMFSHDRFHPSPAGYARAAAALLPTVCAALGLFDEDVERAPSRPQPRRGGHAGRPGGRRAPCATLAPR